MSRFDSVISHNTEKLIEIHWSSVKEVSCLKAIDFSLEACLKY
jgi:hypothetical protein